MLSRVLTLYYGRLQWGAYRTGGKHIILKVKSFGPLVWGVVAEEGKRIVTLPAVDDS